MDRATQGAQGLLNLGVYGLNRAAQGAQGLLNLGVYGLHRASQGAQGVVNIIDPIPAILRESAPVTKQPTNNPPNVTLQPGYTQAELDLLAQHQSDGDTCAVYSAAMAVNMLYGTNISGDAMAKYLHERMWSYKLPWIGTLPSNQEAAINHSFMFSGTHYTARYTNLKNLAMITPKGTAQATYFEKLAKKTLIDNLNNGYVTIVNISHGSNLSTWPPFNGVGHAMVLVGYDANTDEYLFLDPGTAGVVTKMGATDFLDAWLNQPNPFIPSGTMITIKPNP